MSKRSKLNTRLRVRVGEVESYLLRIEKHLEEPNVIKAAQLLEPVLSTDMRVNGIRNRLLREHPDVELRRS